MFKIISIFLLFVIIGCAGGRTVLLKNKKGDIQRCEVSAGDAQRTGVIGRDITINNCIKAYEEAGYIQLSK